MRAKQTATATLLLTPNFFCPAADLAVLSVGFPAVSSRFNSASFCGWSLCNPFAIAAAVLRAASGFVSNLRGALTRPNIEGLLDSG